MTESSFNIKNIDTLSRTPPDIGKTGKGTQSKESFEKILSSTIDNAGSEEIAAKKETGLPEIAAVLPPVSVSNAGADVSNRISEALDLLEKYSLMLSDPLKTLRDISPVLNEINTRIEILDREIRDDLAGDAELTRIIDQLLSTVRVEQYKMERGDYTDMY